MVIKPVISYAVPRSLKKQLAIYQHVIDAAPDIIHIISPEMRIILRNRRSREWFPSVKTGGRCFRWLHDTDKPCRHCSVQRVFQDGQRHEHESIIKGRNQGREIIVHSTASPIYGDDGQLLGALEILRDITERKQMERALQETAARLSRANRLKGLLLRMVRHDLGTPVGAILNTTEYLLEEPEQLGKFLEDVEDIYQCSSHILQLIRDADVLSNVLTTSQLSFQDLDLTTLLTDLILQLEPVMKQAGIQFENLLPCSLPLKGLPILKTVFENILVNGIKYGAGDGRLVLSATETESHISVSITDFGPGIPDEHKKRIFQQFERLATDIPGTGLGLAIASQTVALHGGEIEVQDNPAGGAIFVVRLPKKPSERQPTDSIAYSIAQEGVGKN